MTAARHLATGGAIVRGLGALVDFSRQGASASQTLAAIITRRPAQVWTGGEVAVSEDHYIGHILASSLADPPALGDTMTDADGTRYEIDGSPKQQYGLWEVVLRRLPS